MGVPIIIKTFCAATALSLIATAAGCSGNPALAERNAIIDPLPAHPPHHVASSPEIVQAREGETATATAGTEVIYFQ